MAKFSEEGWFFINSGSYYYQNDSNKDLDPEAKNRGTYRRYCSIFDEMHATEFKPKIDNFVTLTHPGLQSSPALIGVIEQSRGLDSPIFQDTQIRQKVSKYLKRLSNTKGTKKALRFLLQQLGFQGCETEEQHPSGGFDTLPFDTDPGFEGVSGFISFLVIDLTSNPPVKITPSIYEQILNILAYCIPITVTVRRITHNGLTIFLSAGDVESTFKTVKSGQQTIKLVSSTDQAIEIGYTDTGETEQQIGQLFTFVNDYPDNTEKEFTLTFGNETLIIEADFIASELSEVPDLSKYVVLSRFAATFNAPGEALIFDTLPVFSLDLFILSAGNTLQITNDSNLAQIIAETGDAGISIGNLNDIAIIELKGTGSLNLTSLGAGTPQIVFKLQDFTISDFTFIDAASKQSMRLLDFSVSFTNASYNTSTFTQIKEVIFNFSDAGKTFDLSSNPTLTRATIINTVSDHTAVINNVGNSALEFLKLSKQNPPLTISNYANLKELTFVGERIVNASNLPVLEALILDGSNIGAGATDSINISSLPNLKVLSLAGNFLGTAAPGNSAGVIIPAVVNFKNLTTIDFRRCNYSSTELNTIVSAILAAESTPGSEFLNATGKILDLSNQTGFNTGQENEAPAPATIVNIDNLINNYGWSINYVI